PTCARVFQVRGQGVLISQPRNVGSRDTASVGNALSKTGRSSQCQARKDACGSSTQTSLHQNSAPNGTEWKRRGSGRGNCTSGSPRRWPIVPQSATVCCRRHGYPRLTGRPFPLNRSSKENAPNRPTQI